VDLLHVKSTNITSVGYDKKSRVLRILFREGSMYDFEGVPPQLFNQLMAAESKGTFFQEFIKGQFSFTRVNLEKERTTMGQNKAQRAAVERAKKSAVQPQPAEQPAAAAEHPKPEPAPAKPAVQPTPANKQTATFDKLKEAWTEKGVDLSKMTVKPDGKFVLVTVADGWPVVQIGASGGIVLPEIRSYAKAFDAAIDGLALYQKQLARDAKKNAALAPAPAPAPKAKSQAQPAQQSA
jgi:KTSC domain